MKIRYIAVATAILMLMPAPLSAKSLAEVSSDSVRRDGFNFPQNRPLRIMVLRPDVQVGSLSTGGVDEPNADWTAEARKQIAAALERSPEAGIAKFSFFEDPSGDDDAYVAEYRSLFKAVSTAIMIHKLFPGNRLPTKKERFDWTLGPGASHLGEIGNADYALFVMTHDSYGTSGRKAAQIFGALLGAYVQAGIHVGYAGLVDLRTGDILWFNADTAIGGDVRTAEGADKRVGELLLGFPASGGPATAVTTK